MSWEAEEREYIESVSRELEDRKKKILKKEILAEVEKQKPIVGVPVVGVPGSHVYFESEELRKQVEAEVAALPPLPPPEPIETDLNPSVKKHLDAILDTLGYVMVKKTAWEAKLDLLEKLKDWYAKAENRSSGDGKF